MYCTAEHDSLKISNGKWYWWSRGFGGYSALDLSLIHILQMFREVADIQTADMLKRPVPKVNSTPEKVLGHSVAVLIFRR